ncbi:S66 peptidase family protein [Deminuibacter soli]|uniref:LD-carboxypeptidase n=1 Tax=Deminuibacter soli TaxID=2291815 RepID=A0A3E1NNE8_9BACT|nr:LD-carboxypeptidase [Deminuibacter soli]RFM29456.1 LD-carboxypeptidase [Deminuibacter soli]
MITIPPYLKKGDTIGIVCPAGFMPAERAQTCIDVLQQWGYRVRVGKTLGNQHHYFSGTDEERLADLQQMLDDDSVQAVLCGRGGYGVSRIIDRIDFTRFRAKPKWVIGFSDITLLHTHIHTQLGIATLHAPMAGAFNDDAWQGPYVQSLRHALEGGRANYACEAYPLNKTGIAAGELVGGNLSLLVHATGTTSALDTSGKILFMEDIGEYLYNVDRMLLQLKRSGALRNLAGLVVGGFTEMKDTVIPFGDTIENIIHSHLAEYDYPVCYHFPVSHGGDNYALKSGGHYRLQVADGGVRLVEE